MKLVSPCCKNIQEYKPHKPFDWSKRHKTACKKCSINFDVSKDLVVVGESEEKKGEKKTITLGQGKPSNKEFIDDPDELLISVAIRELNKTNPDPRWASILINCKKEKITTQRADIEQFKQLPTKALVSLLSKSSQEEY